MIGAIMDNKFHLGYSALTGNIYLGKQNGDHWVGEKRDVTSEFIQVMLHKFEPNSIQNISVDGHGKYRVLVVDIGKKILVDGKEV